MRLSQALRLSSSARVAFVGAGGKTTALFQLARELAPALVTTSTHLGAWQVSLADRHFTWQPGAALPEMETQLANGITLVSGELQGERYTALSETQLERLQQLAGRHELPLLIEADGARQKALKAPADHEPAIPAFVETVVVLAGLSVLGQPLTDENVQRAELAARLLDCRPAEAVTAEKLAALLAHPQGGLKNIPAQARRIVLLNQADTPELQAQAGQISAALLAKFDALLVASLQQEQVWSVHEPIAGIVLAAGASTRFGRPKQLLDYHGRPFVRKVAQTALEAGLAPVIVVTGAHADLVELALEGLPVVAIRNPGWRDGQSSSIRTALAPLLPAGRGAAGAIFLLADQPQVTPHVIRALLERHAGTRAPIVAPLAADRRANPVLFDRDTFKDLMQVSGDVGGRAIFSNYTVDYLPWHDESLLLDVDTEDDYRKLLAWGVQD